MKASDIEFVKLLGIEQSEDSDGVCTAEGTFGWFISKI